MFDPTCYSPVFTKLLAEDRLNELGPGRPNAEIEPVLKGLFIPELFAPHAIQDRSMADACLAGIWLYHDFLDESHTISQGIATPTGSYWHSIMHRREPDAGNSRYWLNRVGRHPIFPALQSAARTLAEAGEAFEDARFLLQQEAWEPYRFVDLCEASRIGKSKAGQLCRLIQREEWRLLFDYGFHRALG
jgi:hypothetical protein